MKWQHTVNAEDVAFHITLETNVPVNVNVQVMPAAALPHTSLIHVKLESASSEQFDVDDFRIDWKLPIVDMHGLYFGGNPMSELAYLPFWQRQKYTCANSGVPFLALIHRSGENRAAFGLVDQITETSLSVTLSEITRCYHIEFQKPANRESSGQKIPAASSHRETLFVSRAQASWPEVLKAYVHCVDQQTPPMLMPVPDHAYDPVFCTWTAIHHAISHEWILRNARIAADLGFRTWITDDGWFLEDGRFADYSHVGDWEPSAAKFPDFKAHVRAVQELGFRYMLWVSPFMVGNLSQAARRYAHLLTDGQEREQFHNYSPWHPETGDILANLLTRLVNDYDLDGLKIDFLDSMRVHSHKADSVSSYTLGQGIHTILTRSVDRLLSSKPDLLIEFRNSYANLASRNYANVYRSSDVPINFTLNRWQATMLRLLAPDRAVHLDPALWHPDDTDENVAVHLINCLVSVPMVSIELDQYPQSHLDLIRYWIRFYNEHKNTIVHGEFRPVLLLGHVPLIYFVNGSETIVGLYDDTAAPLESVAGTTWILNASTRGYVDFSGSEHKGSSLVVTRDKFGKITSQQTMTFPQSRIEVEVGGSLEFVTE